jgi:ketosteroid isomerase-like protein
MINPPFAVIKSKDINIQVDFGEGYSLGMTGAFTSNAEASGKLVFKGNSRSCGAFEINTTWSAKKTAAASGASTAPPTAPVNSAASNAELEKSVRAFFDAINAKNADAALKFVDDNVVFQIGTTTTGLGKAQLRTYLQTQITRGVTYTLSGVKTEDNEVTFSLKTGTGAVTTDNSITFDDGKMDFVMWK